MSKQYHFVVCYDTETNEFSLDIDSLDANFWNGEVYDTETDEWCGRLIDEATELAYNEAEDNLAELLEKGNQNG